MRIDPDATDISFEGGRMPEEDLPALLSSVWQEMGNAGEPPWKLISARRKMGKTLVELEEMVNGAPRRLIGKTARAERSEGLFTSLSRLWDAGFRPPSKLTVTEPIAYLPRANFVLVEKAPGAPLYSLDDAEAGAPSAAQWLAALHVSSVKAPSVGPDAEKAAKWCLELVERLPERASQIAAIGDGLQARIAEPQEAPVPCHGDFHAQNIFISSCGRITGIDIDKFCAQEPAADVGYFLSQTAAMGYLREHSFQVTDGLRRRFLEAYEQYAGSLPDARRMGLYMALAFVKNIHFELCLLDTGRTELAGLWLQSAESSLLDDDIALRSLAA